MKLFRASALALGLVAAGVVTTSPLAMAAPPPNDDIGGATVIDAIPFLDVVDTTEATITPDEAALNDYCGAPAMEHAVWYTSTPTSDGFAVLDVTGSDYSAGIVVLEGPPDDLVPVACGPGVVSGPYFAGQTRYIMVFGDGVSPATSGTLRFEVRTLVEPPVIDVTIDPVAYVDRDGVATITGTVTCTAPAGDGTVFILDGSARQRVGRGFVDGFFFLELEIPCDGATSTWSALAVPNGGRFAGGKAATVAFAFGCGVDQCSSGYGEAVIQMKRGRPR